MFLALCWNVVDVSHLELVVGFNFQMRSARSGWYMAVDRGSTSSAQLRA